MSEELKKQVPDVSVIVPVYNAEKYLRQTMEYLVCQTMRSLELIFVDDGSTDGSPEILREYQMKYPERVFVYQTPNLGPGEARNKGIQKARGTYIGFADADDYMEYNMYEKMFEAAKDSPCDMVYIPYYLVRDCKKKVMGRISQPELIDQVIFHGEVSFWTKLIHKDLLKKVGKIPEMWFEDTAYMLPVFSYAKNIVYLNEPLYYYIKREGSITNSAADQKTLDTIQAENYALEHCNPLFRQAVAARIADRILFNIQMRWMYSKEFIRHLKTLREDLLENEILKKYPIRYQKIRNYLELPEEIIPARLILPGFGMRKEAVSEKKYLKQALKNAEEVVILNEDTCDLSCSEQVKTAWKEKNYEYLNHYFAVKNLYESGGIFLGEGLKIEKTLDHLRGFSSFFGFLDQKTFTDRIFGCCKGDRVVRELWKTYEKPSFYENIWLPLKHRIRNILIAYAGVPLDNQTHLHEYPCAVFDSSVFVIDSQNPMHICSHSFEHCYATPGYSVFPDTAIASLTEKKSSKDMFPQLDSELKRVTNLKNKLIRQRTELRAENKKLRREIELYKDSKSWKLTEILRRSGRAYRKFQK